MTISHIASAAAIATSVSFGTTAQAGDLIIVSAYRNGNATPPTLAAGYTTILGNTGANTNAIRVGFMIAAGGETTTGTWANASSIAVSIYRASAGNALTIGAAAEGGGNAQTTVTAPALTLQNTDGSSWVYVALGSKTDTTLATTAFSSTTRRASAGTGGGIGCYDSNAGVASWSAVTKSHTSGANRTASVEIKELPPRVVTANQTTSAVTQTSSVAVVPPRNLSTSQTMSAPTQTSSVEVVPVPGSSRLWHPGDYAGSDRYAWGRLKNTGATTASAITYSTVAGDTTHVRTVGDKWNANDFTAPQLTESWHTMPLGTLNGHPALDFQVSDHHLNGPEIAAAYTGPVTLIAVGARPSSDVGGNRGLVGSRNNYFGLTTDGSASPNIRFRAGFNGSEYWPPNFMPSAMGVGVVQFDNSADEIITCDGGTPTIWNTNAYSIGGSGDCWQIGRWANGETHLGQIGEWLIIHGKPDQATIDKFVGYLVWDWFGNGDRLPSGHTYKTAAPTVTVSGGNAICNVTAAQTLSAATQTSSINVAAAALTVTSAQNTQTSTQTSAVAVWASLTASQNTQAVTQTSAVAVRGTITAAQTTSAATQTSAIGNRVSVTSAQTLSATTQTATVNLSVQATSVQNANVATQSAMSKVDVISSAAQVTSITAQNSSITVVTPGLMVSGAQTTQAAIMTPGTATRNLLPSDIPDVYWFDSTDNAQISQIGGRINTLTSKGHGALTMTFQGTQKPELLASTSMTNTQVISCEPANLNFGRIDTTLVPATVGVFFRARARTSPTTLFGNAGSSNFTNYAIYVVSSGYDGVDVYDPTYSSGVSIYPPNRGDTTSISIRNGPSNVIIRKNGFQDSGGNAAVDTGSSSELVFGAYWNGGSSYIDYGALDYGDIWFSTRQLTDAEIHQIEGSIHWARGCQNLLADSHPYKAAPPTIEGSGAAENIDILVASTTSQNLAAITQDTETDLVVAASAAQTTEAATQNTSVSIQNFDAREISGAQTTAAATQSASVDIDAALSGAQSTAAVTQSATTNVQVALAGAQTLSAVTQSATVSARITTTAAQTTGAASQANDTDVVVATSAAQNTQAVTQSVTVSVEDFPARVVTGVQTTSAATQTTSANAIIASSAAQATNAVTQTTSIKPVASLTTAQTTSAITQGSSLSVPASLTASQTAHSTSQAASASLSASVSTSQATSATTQSAVADIDAQATAAQGTSAVTQSSSVQPRVTVTSAQSTSATTQSATASIPALGTASVNGAQTLSAATSTATGDVDTAATAAQTLVAPSQNSNIDPAVAVSGAQTTSAAITSASASAEEFGARTASAAQTLSAATNATATEVRIAATVGQIMAAALQAASAELELQANGAQTLAGVQTDAVVALPITNTATHTLEAVDTLALADVDVGLEGGQVLASLSQFALVRHAKARQRAASLLPF